MWNAIVAIGRRDLINDKIGGVQYGGGGDWNYQCK